MGLYQIRVFQTQSDMALLKFEKFYSLSFMYLIPNNLFLSITNRG